MLSLVPENTIRKVGEKEREAFGRRIEMESKSEREICDFDTDQK